MQDSFRDSGLGLNQSFVFVVSTDPNPSEITAIFNRTYAIYVRLDYVPQGPRALRAFMSGWARKPKLSTPIAF